LISSAKGSIRKLHFSFTSLERVPTSLLTSNAESLQYLNLSNNKVIELPNEVKAA
jgi:Leucine-rich repeat (LRR) protein